jgi:hypothetical protein
MPYPEFDRSRLRLQSLQERHHDLTAEVMLQPQQAQLVTDTPQLRAVAEALREAARQRIDGAPATILMLGAHVIRRGVSLLIIDLMERGLISHVAMNGAGPIHEWELALVGATTENVARYLREGQFGLWKETGQLNEIIRAAYREGLGLGEAIGQAIAASGSPWAQLSILAAAFRLKIPATVHVGIGYDILHEHPNCDGAALGATSYRDFLIFAHSVERLEGGVLICAGSAVMGPEVFLKALAMARNVAHQTGRVIQHFTTAVIDLQPLEAVDPAAEPARDDPRYYFRPWKTILSRSVSSSGKSYYIHGDHRDTFSSLYRLTVDG